MKTTFSLTLLVCIFIAFQSTSCMNGNKYPKETRMLDSLQTLVTRADSTVKTIDSAKIAGYAKHAGDDMGLIEMLHVDSMSPGAAEIFRNFNSIRWSLMAIAGKKGPLLTELEKSQKQLNHLSHDLSHNLIKADSVELYIGYETKKATELIQASDLSASELTNQLPIYTALAPKADSLISLLKDHKKI